MKVSIIIPTLNEADCLPATLLRVQSQAGPKEILVVDGGSEDGTRNVARDFGVRCLTAPRGRSLQMNRGAARASGDALLFLHADTLLPPAGLSTVRRTLSPPGVEAGIFRLRFDRETPLLRLYAWATHLNWIRLAFGDRGLFVTRPAFEAVGGYPDWPIFEDLELADRLHRRGGFRFVDDAVVTSARRFQKHGTVRQQLRNAYLWMHYCAGTEPDAVAHVYEYE
jgi:rSAM/selenodomain-associated transferase 2